MLVAIDTGGTKTLIASFDDSGNKQTIAKFPTPKDTAEYLEAVASHIHKNIEDSSISAISVAMPGPIHDSKVLRTPNIGWSDFDVIRDLGAYFPGVQIFLENDATLAGLSEARQLNSSGLCAYVTLSTGVGSGIAYSGHLLPQLERFEAGSVRVEYEGQLQRWENIASGKSFYERHGQFGSDVTDPLIWEDYAKRVALGMQIIIPLLEPDHLVIGGSMGTHFAKYSTQLNALLDATISKHMQRTCIVQAVHPEEAVIYGCYYHALDSLSAQTA